MNALLVNEIEEPRRRNCKKTDQTTMRASGRLYEAETGMSRHNLRAAARSVNQF